MATKDFEDNNNDFDFSWEEASDDHTVDSKKKPVHEEDFSAFSSMDFDLEKPSSKDKEEEDYNFSFDAMPTQTEFAPEKHEAGNPVDEFAEFGYVEDSHSEIENSASEEDAFSRAFAADDGMEGFEDSANSFEADNFNTQEIDDPYEQVSKAAPVPKTLVQVTDEKPLLSKLILPVGLAATVAVVGFVGYSYIMPSSKPAAPAVAQNEVKTQAPAFPKTLPGQSITSTPPAAGSVSPPADKPAVPGGVKNSAPTELSFDLPADTNKDTGKNPVSPPSVSGNSALPTPAVTAAQQPAVNGTPTSVKPLDQSATASPKPAVSTPVADTNFVSKDDLKSVLKRLDDMQSKMNSLEGKVEKLAINFQDKVSMPISPSLPGAGASLPVSTDNPGSLNSNASPVATVDSVNPPLKPVIIDGIKLAGVSGDIAWVKTGADTSEVHVGDVLPHGGKVLSIRDYLGDWIIVTDQGIIVR